MNQRSKPTFEHQSLQDSASLVEYLSALGEGFAKGSLQFRDNSGEITLEPAGLIRFEIHAANQDSEHAITLKFSWKRPAKDEDDPGPLLINGVHD